MSFDYRIGVKLALTSNMPAMLTALGNNILGLNVKVDQLTGKFTRMQKAVAGVGAVWAGSKMIGGMATLAKYGDKIVEQQAQLRTLGISRQKIAAATAYATRVANEVPTTTIAGNLKHLGELRYAGGSTAIAKAILPMVSQANAILRSKLGNIDTDQIWPIVKSLEMKGVLNPQTMPRFQKYLGEMVQAVVATNGVVTPRDFLKTFVYGRTAMLGWDSTFMPYLTRAMQSLGTSGTGGGGRSGPGNALMSAFAAVVQGQMPKKAAQTFAALGLGSMQGIAGSGQALTAIHRVKLFESNPYQWVQTVLMPALAAHHITMPNGMNPDNLKKLFGNKAGVAEAQQRNDIIGVISQLFRNRTASQIISEFALFGSYAQGNASMYEKDKRMQKQALGLRAYGQLMKLSPGMRQMIVAAQYENMMEAMGKALVPIQMTVLAGLTRVFNAIANLSMSHPEAVKAIAVGITALGAALMGAGIIALLGAIGAGGWLIGGLVGLAAALAAFGGGMSLRALATGIHAVATAVSVGVLAAALGAGGWMAVGIAAIAAALDLIPWQTALNGLATGLTKFGHVLEALWDKLKGWAAGGFGWLKNHVSYSSPGIGGGSLTPANYGGGAFFNDGVFYKGAGRIGASLGGGLGHAYGVPGGVIIGGTHHHAGGQVVMPGIPGTLTGNAYIKATRAGFAKELADPNKRLAFAAMMLSEGGKNSLPVAESAMNRSLYSHKTLMQMLASGFYGPIRRGELPAFEARLKHNPKLMGQMNALINKSLAGSDTIRGFTDQGMISDPNGHWGLMHSHMMKGGNIFTDWGGGPGGHHGSEAWRQDFEAHADSLPSPAIAAGGGDRHVTVHSTIKLDGRTVANNTARHFARQGNMPPRSGRLPDPFAHSPALPVI